MALDYARMRKQFGVPIGSFQSIKHLLVDLAIDVECARSAVYLACAHEHEPDQFARYVAVAKAWCARVYLAAAGTNIQIHGGIGFSAEHLASRHFTRATVTRTLFGVPAHQLDLVADSLGV
jgi:alkylation response protein AidB-like acyl-CoA dehydrogenase